MEIDTQTDTRGTATEVIWRQESGAGQETGTGYFSECSNPLPPGRRRDDAAAGSTLSVSKRQGALGFWLDEQVCLRRGSPCLSGQDCWHCLPKPELSTSTQVIVGDPTVTAGQNALQFAPSIRMVFNHRRSGAPAHHANHAK